MINQNVHNDLYKICLVLSKDEFIDISVKQLRLLNPNIVVHRITGDPDKENLIEPTWVLKKFVVLNDIDKLMRKENYYQGDLYVQNSRI